MALFRRPRAVVVAMRRERLEALRALAKGPPLDLAVIGGGINGCAIAREAAGRGLRVALFEQDDFGFGTTWRSTKLIHGGLRYLEHGEVGLVFESLRERAWLLRTRPHLVRPQRFLFPQLPWTRRPAWQLKVGLTAYDALAFRGALARHRRLGGAGTQRAEPGVAGEASGSFLFWDARAIAPERLALELALEAEGFGASVFNHARVSRIELTGGAVSAVEVVAGGESITVPAKAVVNAAGPWVDAVAALTGEQPPLLGATKGTHIVLELDRPLPQSAIFSTARSDGRVFFIVPQDGLLLIGTTDDRYGGAPGDVRPTREEAEYLLEEAGAVLPGFGFAAAQVRYAYAGLRPLPAARGVEASITRRHVVIDHGKRAGPEGLISVAGGKLSTFRPLANQVTGRFATGRHAPWPSAPAGGPASGRLGRYGGASDGVAGLGSDLLCPHSGLVAGEVRHAVRAELAASVSDVSLRRTGASWASCRGRCCAAAVATIAGEELGWSAGERDASLAAFEAEVERHLPELAGLV
ncbi:MAG: FAD-dependent oxidoreductase [Dehalococcoidia bacterium]